MRVLPTERLLPDGGGSTPLPDSSSEQPPVIRRAEVVAFALVALLVIVVVAVLYLAKAFFLPVTMAFVVGTMLSPAASLLERYRIPRAVGAVLIVVTVAAAMVFMVGLISSPLMDWSAHLPELGARLKDKLHVFDRPLALWQELQSMLGGSDALTGFQMPKFEWVQPTLEFLSPTFTECLLFFAILILFIASWRDLRRTLVLTFARSRRPPADAAHPQRDRGPSRQLSSDRHHDQCRRRHCDRHRLRGRAYAQSGRPRRAGRDLELHSDHRPGRDVRDPARRRHRRAADT